MRRGMLVLPMAAVLVMTIGTGPVAGAHPPLLKARAHSPTRGPGEKGAGSRAGSQPTGRIIVRYREGTSNTARLRLRASIGARFVSAVALDDSELLEPVGGVAAAIAGLSRDPDVLLVEREFRRTIAGGPVSEPLIGEQWSLKNTGQVVNGFAGANDVDMNVPEAWGVTTGSPTIVVAVIDDGVDFSHPDLVDRAWHNPGEIAGNGIDDEGNGLVDDANGWDFCNNDNSLHDPDDFHGTHVAGSIAASGNGVGTAGVAPTVRIMALKFLSDDPSCGTDSQAIAAIDYAASHGAQIINASWGGPDYSAAVAASIDAAGTLLVAAAGNENADNEVFPFYPAAYDLPNILSVASIHNQGFLSFFSNYGVHTVDLSAPGEDILSTLPGATYGYLSGTSMAAANTSGAAALAASAHPALASDGAAFRNHMIATARALPSTLGWVRSPRLIDARAAVVSRPDIRRLSGADRYATSAAISAATFTPNVPYLFIATGEGFPDALAGGAVAAQFGAPLLLVKAGSIPPATLSEIQRLQPFDIFVLGGTGVISNAVQAQLAGYDDPSSTGPYRLAGADRYATAVAISQAAFDRAGTVFIVNGANFPDALAGGPAAASLAAPVLLTRTASLPGVTKAELLRLQAGHVVILGGTGAVSAAVQTQLKAIVGASNVQRWAGADRYATAAAVSSHAFAAAATAFVAAGQTFPDALSGGPAGGAYAAPLLLTRTTSTPAGTKQELVRLHPVRIFVLGGSAAVSNAVIAEINALFP
jgi:putative cell wall-binding protein